MWLHKFPKKEICDTGENSPPVSVKIVLFKNEFLLVRFYTRDNKITSQSDPKYNLITDYHSKFFDNFRKRFYSYGITNFSFTYTCRRRWIIL